MDLNLQSCGLHQWESVCDDLWEVPLEWDILLPEGNPDIGRLLCAQATPCPAGWDLTDNRLTVQGCVHINALYLDEEGTLCQASFKQPISKTAELAVNVASPVCHLQLWVDYFHCRVVNPRRLDMRGALSVSANIWQQREQMVLTDGTGVELRKRQVSACRLLPTVLSGYELNEELELGYGKPLVQSVLHMGARVEVMDKKPVSGKLVIKGELCITLLYRPQEAEKTGETMEYALPFTHVADIAGLDDSWVCGVTYDVGNILVKPSGRQDAYGSRLSLTASLTASINGYLPVATHIVQDAYSTGWETAFTEKKLPVLTPLGMVSEQYGLKETLSCPTLREVLYLWLHTGATQCRMESGNAVITFHAEACILGKDENGGILYHQQPWEIRQTVPFSRSSEPLLFLPTASLENPGYALGTGEGTLRGTLRIEGFLYSMASVSALSELSLRMDQPKQSAGDRIYLYYADGSRSLWDISKSHNAACAPVLEENDLDNMDSSPMGLVVIPANS